MPVHCELFRPGPKTQETEEFCFIKHKLAFKLYQNGSLTNPLKILKTHKVGAQSPHRKCFAFQTKGNRSASKDPRNVARRTNLSAKLPLGLENPMVLRLFYGQQIFLWKIKKKSPLFTFAANAVLCGRLAKGLTDPSWFGKETLLNQRDLQGLRVQQAGQLSAA